MVHEMKTIICIGRLVYAKGVQDLLLATYQTGIRVLIVGDGSYRKELEKLTHEGVEFLGTMNKCQIRTLLRHSDLLVMPSYNEGLPTVILEALAMNVPVLSSNVGCVMDIPNITVYEAGNITGLRLGILKCLSEKRKNVRKEIIKNFSWKANADKFYNMLISR